MRWVLSLSVIVALAGCADLRQGLFNRGDAAPPATATPPATVTPVAAPAGDAPPEDTVGTGDPLAAPLANPDEDGGPAAAQPASDGRLGTTLATLDATQQGFSVKTPLVTAPTSGRVVNIATGRSVQVELVPNDGPAGGGSQVSLAAMRMLDADLTGLTELVVYGNPA